ncbi:MAG: hypothetical protein HZB56_02480 [Deltaproteobacteria bacterium]|nr:hypothetical protein [Deltaproteobacteria bacterium]
MHRIAIILLLLGVGCAAPAFVARDGRATPRGDFEVGLGSGYQLGTSAASAVKEARDLAKKLDQARVACPDPAQQCWTLADTRNVARGAYRFALNSPLSSHTALWGRYGFGSGLDVGLRWGPSNWGADLGWQLFGPADPAAEGWAGLLSAGYGSRDMGALGTVIEDYLHGSTSLRDLSIAFVAGRQFGRVAHFYAGARYVRTWWKLVVLPDLPIVYDAADYQRSLLGTDAKGGLDHLGAVLGGKVGWKSVFIGLELDLTYTRGKTRVLFEELELSGLGVMPAVYLTGRF